MDWARKWGMAFNISKCKVMHIGRANRHFPYTMAGKVLAVTNEERDLGVVVSDKLKPAAQCAQAARTAQAVLGQITRVFQYRTSPQSYYPVNSVKLYHKIPFSFSLHFLP
jgi:hypothetical protein